MSTAVQISDSDTERGCNTPSSSSSGLTQQENMNDTTGNMLLSLADQPTNLVAVAAAISSNEDIEMVAGSPTKLEISLRDSRSTDLASEQQEGNHGPDGDMDMTLIVGQSNIKTFKTLSSLLASTSSIWKDRVNTAKEAGSKSLHLPNDDPDTMLLFTQIVHLRFSDLPKSISFEQLHSLSRFCDKYQVRHLFLPFMPRWASPFIRETLDPAQPEWLCISAVWEIEYILYPWLDHLCWNTRKDCDSSLTYSGLKLTELLPDSCRDRIMGIVREKRISALSDLVSACKAALDRGRCLEGSHEEQCNMLMTGYLLTGLKNCVDWPLDPKTSQISAEEFRTMILGLSFEPLPMVTGNDEDHSDCGLHALRRDIAAINTDVHYSLFGRSSIGFPFLPYLPSWRRAGLHARDYEDLDSDSEDDAKYRQPSFDPTQPDEEFQYDTDPEDREESEDSYPDSESSFDDSDEDL